MSISATRPEIVVRLEELISRMDFESASTSASRAVSKQAHSS